MGLEHLSAALNGFWWALSIDSSGENIIQHATDYDCIKKLFKIMYHTAGIGYKK